MKMPTIFFLNMHTQINIYYYIHQLLTLAKLTLDCHIHSFLYYNHYKVILYGGWAWYEGF